MTDEPDLRQPLSHLLQLRFYQTSLRVLHRSRIEYRRESGPYRDALIGTHLPRAEVNVGRMKECHRAVYSAALHQVVESAEAFGQSMQADDQEYDYTSRVIELFDKHVVEKLRGVENSTEARIKLIVGRTERFCRRFGKIILKKATLMRERVGESLVQAAVCEPGEDEPICATVLSVDLVQYGLHSGVVHQYLDAVGVLQLNEKIVSYIASALSDIRSDGVKTFMQPTGDGAIVVLGGGDIAATADHAVRFSDRFFEIVSEANQNRARNSELHFRIGASSGEIAIKETRFRNGKLISFRMGGLIVAGAVRLETETTPKSLLICDETFGSLKDSDTTRFLKHDDLVKGKSHEELNIVAYKCDF